MWGGIPTPHEPCSYYYSPYHHVKDCPIAGQFSNYSYEHMSKQFSRPRNEPYCNSYNPGWSNQSNILWQAQAPENYAPQFYELYHQAYPQLIKRSIHHLTSILPTSNGNHLHIVLTLRITGSLLLKLQYLLNQIPTFKLRY
jgi:hypothetical protein